MGTAYAEGSPPLRRTGERGGELRRVTTGQEVYEILILVRKHEC